MDVSRRQVLKTLPVGASIGLTGCSVGGGNTAFMQVEYDDCWRGHFGAKTGDGRDVVLSVNGDGEDSDDADLGRRQDGVWSITVPEDIPQDVSIKPPVIVTATISNHTTCPGGDAREWSSTTLKLSLDYNGETVGADTVQDKGNEARVEHRP